jgi:hypothetical protein
VSKRKCILKLYKDLNGKLITDGKKEQLIKMGSVLNVEPILINDYNFNLDSDGLAGFINADGSFTIRNSYTLTISIAQKTSGELYTIKNKLMCGNVYYDKRGNTHNYAVTHLMGIKKLLSYFEKYSLKTSKNIDCIRFRKLVTYIELKYHYKNNPCKNKIDDLIKIFKDSYKI